MKKIFAAAALAAIILTNGTAAAEHLPACGRCYPLIMLLFGLRIICGAAVAISWRR